MVPVFTAVMKQSDGRCSTQWGTPYGYISTSVQYTMRSRLSGYNLVTGLNDTIFNRFGSDIALTVDQNACAAAYNALGGKNGGVIVYNYKTGEILVKVSTPTFDPNAVPGGPGDQRDL